MGNIVRKNAVDKRTGMTKREKTLLRDTWHKFCQKNPDFGSLVLLAMFTRHPESQALFPRFQGREVRHLRDDSEFLAFAAVVGRQMSAMVDSVNDYDALCEVARKNATDHAQREGVHAGHFEDFFSVTLGEMTESDESAMTPAAVAAWEKFFVILNKITKQVFEEAAKAAKATKEAEEAKPAKEAKAAKAAKEAKTAKAAAGTTSPPKDQGHSSNDELTSTPVSPMPATSSAAQKVTSPLAIQSVIKGARTDHKPVWRSGIKEKHNKPPK